MKHHHIYDSGKCYLVQIGTHPHRVRKAFSTLDAAVAFRDSVLASLPEKPAVIPKVKPKRRKRVPTPPGDELSALRLDSSAPSGLSWVAGAGKRVGHAGWAVPGGYAVRINGRVLRCARIIQALRGPTQAERIAASKARTKRLAR